LQEDTAAADKEVAAAVEHLKTLKLVVEGLEKDLEEITGIPRDKGAFRDAVVSARVRCAALLWVCWLLTCPWDCRPRHLKAGYSTSRLFLSTEAWQAFTTMGHRGLL
jgi:hypothetical protein